MFSLMIILCWLYLTRFEPMYWRKLILNLASCIMYYIMYYIMFQNRKAVKPVSNLIVLNGIGFIPYYIIYWLQ